MLKYCRRAILVIVFYLMLLWLGSMLLIGNVAALPLLLGPRRLREPLMQWVISSTCRLFLSGCQACGVMRLDLSALDGLNRESGLLLVPNHPSMIDAFLVLSRVRHITCLMKASIGSNLFLGAGAYIAGYVPNGQPERMFRAAIRTVSRGGVLMIFPEGTRTLRPPVNPLQGAAALIAKRAKAPLQTILITTNSPYLSKGWKIWRPPEFPIHYRAVPGRRFAATDNLKDATAELQRYFESALAEPAAPGS